MKKWMPCTAGRVIWIQERVIEAIRQPALRAFEAVWWHGHDWWAECVTMAIKKRVNFASERRLRI